MKKATKITLTIALCFLAIGMVLYIAAIRATGQFGYNPGELDTVGTVTQTEFVEEFFHSIHITDVECDIHILPAEDGRVSVVYTDTDLYRHELQVRDGTLVITAKNTGSFWGQFFVIDTIEQEVTVYLPFSDLDELRLETVSGEVHIAPSFSVRTLSASSTSGNVEASCPVSETLNASSVSGNIHLSDTRPQSVNCSTTSGNISLERAEAANLFIDTVSGEVFLSEVTIAEFTDLSSVSGGIHLNHMDSSTLTASTVSGSITGTVPSVKCFDTDTTSGSIYVSDHTSDAPVWEISTVSGDIHITVNP